jgi:hypothetical protein
MGAKKSDGEDTGSILRHCARRAICNHASYCEPRGLDPLVTGALREIGFDQRSADDDHEKRVARYSQKWNFQERPMCADLAVPDLALGVQPDLAARSLVSGEPRPM